jgi:hypothetical protein
MIKEQDLEDFSIILTQDAVKNLYLVAVKKTEIISNLKTNVKECVEATVCIDRELTYF